jgi:dTDP-4-amino-4,6-dideoxygalactose transaminase
MPSGLSRGRNKPRKELMLHFEDIRYNRLLYPLIEKELRKVVFTFDDISSLRRQYGAEVEMAFSSFIGTKGALLVDSGTTALILSLVAMGVKAGDRVIVPVNAYRASAFAVVATGAVPVFVDIDENVNIDVNLIEQHIDRKTKVILPVYMYGIGIDMGRVKKIASKHKLKIVEDVCQASGGSFKGKKFGSIGDAGAFSFQLEKNISTLGGGGAITFNDIKLREKFFNMVYYDRENPALLEAKRASCWMSFADLVFLRVKLKVARMIEKSKDELRRLYESRLSALSGVHLVLDGPGEHSIRQFYFLHVEKRNELYRYLLRHDIVCRLPYKSLHKSRLFRVYAKGRKFPRADAYDRTGLCLPMFPWMKTQEAKYICDLIKRFYAK